MQSAPGRSPAGGSGSSSSSSPRPHLLALHGWRTSATVLTKQLQRSGLDQVLSEAADLTCLDAPHAARGPPTPDVRRAFQPPFYEWWDAVQDDANGGAVRYVGAEETLQLLSERLRAAAAAGRPVSGLVGFSQGAALAGLVAALQERGEGFQDVPALRCVVMIAGNVVRDPAFQHLYGRGGRDDGDGTATPAGGGGAAAAAPASAAVAAVPLSLPSCHLVGSVDPLRGNSEKLMGAFRQPLVLRHDQGHVVPRLDPEQRRQLTDFLRSNLPLPPPQQPLSALGAAPGIRG